MSLKIPTKNCQNLSIFAAMLLSYHLCGNFSLFIKHIGVFAVKYPILAAFLWLCSCAASTDTDCADAADCEDKGNAAALALDLEKALFYHEKSCIFGNFYACETAVSMHGTGINGEPDIAKAIALMEIFCANLPDYTLSDEEKRISVTECKDFENGKEMWRDETNFKQVTCNSGDDCFTKNAKHWAVRDFLTARVYAEKGCAFDHAQSCTSLGDYHAHGLTTKRDPHKAQEYFQKACRLGDQEGCKLRSQ